MSWSTAITKTDARSWPLNNKTELTHDTDRAPNIKSFWCLNKWLQKNCQDFAKQVAPYLFQEERVYHLIAILGATNWKLPFTTNKKESLKQNQLKFSEKIPEYDRCKVLSDLRNWGCSMWCS